MTFNLWYRLSEELYEKDSEPLTAFFKPYVENLVVTLCRHCQMDAGIGAKSPLFMVVKSNLTWIRSSTDQLDLLEEDDDFFDFRSRVTELIKDVVYVVESHTLFYSMFEHINNVVTSHTANWDVMEAALFIMAAVAR